MNVLNALEIRMTFRLFCLIIYKQALKHAKRTSVRNIFLAFST